jgi:hypothetical protein
MFYRPSQNNLCKKIPDIFDIPGTVTLKLTYEKETITNIGCNYK